MLRNAGVRTICLAGCGYAYATLDGELQPLHRILMKLNGVDIYKKEVDHRNGKKLDNRIPNLRVATRKQNGANLGVSRKNGSSGFKGVHFNKEKKKWMAHISPNGRFMQLGYYKSPVEAAKRYNKYAKKFFGKFAKLNCIPKQPR